ncbi:hypothetical protein [Streptomyces sp. NPDC001816]|uniref:hypothetical protein n=1 Tax=Streptomyces sp. NPDC001816 TaxID=3364612 RepID=UPI0036B31942
MWPLAAPYGRSLVERGALGGFQLGNAEVVGDLAPHVARMSGHESTRTRGQAIGTKKGQHPSPAAVVRMLREYDENATTTASA